MRLLRSEAGGLIAAVPWLIFGFTMFYIAADYDQIQHGDPNQTAQVEQRVAEVENAAKRYDQLAQNTESDNPELAAQYQQKANELRRAAGIMKRAAGSKVSTSGSGADGPIAYRNKSPDEMISMGANSTSERALLEKLKDVDSRVQKSDVFRDIVKGRLYGIYQAMGGRFGKDDKPLDTQLMDSATKRMVSVYGEKYKNDPLARRREYQKAWKEMTGQEPGVASGNGPWIVWYAKNIAYEPLFLTTAAQFVRDEPAMDFESGGVDPMVDLDKVHALGPYPTKEAALKDLWNDKLKNIRNLGGINYYVKVADVSGGMHNINHLPLDKSTSTTVILE